MAFKIQIFCCVSIIIEATLCEGNVLIGNRISKEAQYRVDLEIFKQVDRFYTIFRKAEVWKNYDVVDVQSRFTFLIDDDNVKELKHYMNFFGVLDFFFNNSTISFSILYTKYTAMYHAMHLLNLYKFRNNYAAENNNSEILKMYLQLSQYFAWYARTGNDVVQQAIRNAIESKSPKLKDCAMEPYEKFVTSFNNFLEKIYDEYFTDEKTISSSPAVNYKTFWFKIFSDYDKDITEINQYFTAILAGEPVEIINQTDFLEVIPMEESIENFVSNLIAMKGRDIDETYFNFDNAYAKKDMMEANVKNVIWTIENHHMQHPEAKAEKKNSELNEKTLVLLPIEAEKLYTCLKFTLIDHDLVSFAKKEN